jgi:hypothetical protein
MLRLFYYLFLNRGHLGLRFFYLSFYRMCRRIYSRLFTLDTLDKRFLCLFFCNSLIGLYSFLVVSNPSLRLAEIFVLLPLIHLYLFFASKKLIGTAYYHYIWLIGMVTILMLNSSTFILDLLYYEGLLLQHENNQELSFLGQSLVKFVSSLCEVLEISNFSFCTTEVKLEIQINKPKTVIDPSPPLYSKVKDATWNALTRGGGTGLFVHTTMKGNPRLTYVVAGTTALISFVSDLIDN